MTLKCNLVYNRTGGILKTILITGKNIMDIKQKAVLLMKEKGVVIAKLTEQTKFNPISIDLDLSKIIYCNSCKMWFDSGKGWFAKSKKMDSNELPTCPNCNAPLMEIEKDKFFKNNSKQFSEVMKYEWPDGPFWKDNIVVDTADNN